ncbi:transposase [Streptomyces sp. NPDC088748]|uniref:transposase n=1 Tax=Streptomyces sp. NPDC088748 TaxID=3365887 RepID=UPI003801B7D9
MKHYPAEFKAAAVALYESRPGATIRSVAADLGVNPETLRNWSRRGESAAGRRAEGTAEEAAPLPLARQAGDRRCSRGDVSRERAVRCPP